MAKAKGSAKVYCASDQTIQGRIWNAGAPAFVLVVLDPSKLISAPLEAAKTASRIKTQKQILPWKSA